MNLKTENLGGFISAFSMGSLTQNTECGLYGELDGFNATNQAIPLGVRQEIETGKAYIFTTVSGTTPKKYEICIEKIDLADSDENRNMIIRVTDEELLRETGGIIKMEAPIHISNLNPVDKNGKPTRIGRRKNDEGKTVRYSKNTGEEIK